MQITSSAAALKHVRMPVWKPFRALFMGALISTLALILAGMPARAEANPEQFVAVNIQKGFDILNDRSLPDARRRAEFRDFLISLTDIKRIGLFTLGPARRTASPQDVDAFVDAFRDFAVAIYESRLSAFSGQTLKVTGSSEVGPGDTVVHTQMVDPRASGQPPLNVDFRVSHRNGKFNVIDVSVAGIWLAIEERDQFASFLNDNGNNVGALTRHLRDMTRQIRNGAAPQTADHGG